MTTTGDVSRGANVVTMGLLTLPVIGLLLTPIYPLGMVGKEPPWFLHAVSPVAILIGVAIVWRWPGRGWQWSLILGVLSTLVGTIALAMNEPPGLVIEPAVAIASTLGGWLLLIGAFGAASWLARSGARGLGAAVGGAAVACLTVGWTWRLLEFGKPSDTTLLFIAVSVALIASAALLGFGQAGSDADRPNPRLLLIGGAVAAAEVAFALVSRRFNPADYETYSATAAAVIAVLLLLSLLVGIRFLVTVVVIGALVAGTSRLRGALEAMASDQLFAAMAGGTDERPPAIGAEAWLLIAAGLVLGLAVSLPRFRALLAAIGASAAGVAIYLADDGDPTNQLLPKAAIAAAVFALVAGVGAAVSRASAAMVAAGLAGMMVGGSVDAATWFWQPGVFYSSTPLSAPTLWGPIVLLGVAALGLVGLHLYRDDAPAVGGDDLDRADLVGVDER
ncbi:MAG TPA: hypothetical protein VM677_06370 [Actinokineospora sp.]|nr:hypothetical protein [Actinokineospora sp.]